MGDLTQAILRRARADPTPEALAVMRLSVMDWVAVGLAGLHEPVAQVVRNMILAEQGCGVATLFGGGMAPARAAALVNGTTSHALDYDDTHFAHIGHPSVAVIPAALAVAEVEAASFAQFLHAALAGCEASIRMGLALGRGHYQAGFHQTATAGAFGATVAAVLQMTPDARVHGHAIGLASTRASGLKSQFGTMGKPYNAGMAAATGVEAAQLAARGFISDPDGWDGPQGVIAVLHGDGAVSTEPGHFMTSVSHKFHACCHGLHAALEAFSTLAADPAGIDGIVVRTHPRWMNVCNKDDPQTGLEVKFSYRAVLALAACGHDTAKLATYSDSLARDAGLRVFRDKITVVADSSLTEMQAVVQVTSRTGTSEARHDLEQSIALVDRQARIRAKSAALLGNDMAKSLWEAVHAERLAPLIALMKG